MGYFQVRYDSRVINYDCRGFIRLATGTVELLCSDSVHRGGGDGVGGRSGVGRRSSTALYKHLASILSPFLRLCCPFVRFLLFFTITISELESSMDRHK